MKYKDNQILDTNDFDIQQKLMFMFIDRLESIISNKNIKNQILFE